MCTLKPFNGFIIQGSPALSLRAYFRLEKWPNVIPLEDCFQLSEEVGGASRARLPTPSAY